VVIRPEPPRRPEPVPVVEAETRPEPHVVELPAPEPEPVVHQPLLMSPPEDELRAPLPERPFAAEIDIEPPQPGAAEVDEENGIARIDSRRLSHYVSGPPPRATFRGDVSRAEGAAAPPRPRRTEPLRGR
jgi:hypothetical protein